MIPFVKFSVKYGKEIDKNHTKFLIANLKNVYLSTKLFICGFKVIFYICRSGILNVMYLPVIPK